MYAQTAICHRGRMRSLKHRPLGHTAKCNVCCRASCLVDGFNPRSDRDAVVHNNVVIALGECSDTVSARS